MKHAILLVALSACATGGAARDAARLQRQVEDMHRQTDNDRHALHELENRVFVLEDKLETAQVERDKRPDAVPQLPVVTRAPAPPAPRPLPPIRIDDEPASEPLAAAPVEEEVDDGRPPIVIKMDGGGGHVAVAPTPAPAATREMPADLAAVNEKLPVVPLPPHGAKPAPAPGVEDPMSAYQHAYAALQKREHAAAITGFRAFLERWPTHDYSDNAQYWLGEAYYDQADYQTALAEFRTVVKRYPGGNKVPDALLKVGFCMSKLGDSTGASSVLSQVVQIYPKSDAARLAQQRLTELRGRQLR